MPEDCLLLQPTSPLRIAADIDGAVEKYRTEGCHSLVSVHEMIEHPYECVTPEGAGWKFLERPEHNAERRQDYGRSFYFINGAVYVVKSRMLLQQRKFLIEGETGLYVMPQERGIDIDNMHQLRMAEAWLNNARN